MPVSQPAVSVVIPTRGRAKLIAETLQSVARQTWQDFEVVVAMDGYDEGCADVVRALADERFRCVHHAQAQGANHARNLGIQMARGRWIAMLDDDDTWLPQKLERQLAVVGALSCPLPIVACQAIQRMPGADILLPRRPMRPGEHFSEYNLIRSGLTYGDGHIQTSTLLAPRELFLQIPWSEGRHVFHETDWLLRALKDTPATLTVIMEPLSIWDAAERPDRLSITSCDWQHSLEWASKQRGYFTPRGYGALLCTLIADNASRGGGLRAFPPVFKELLAFGKPSGRELVLFAYIWLLPTKCRRRIREKLCRLTASKGSGFSY